MKRFDPINEMPLLNPSHYKMVKSGNLIEIYIFAAPIEFGMKIKNNKIEFEPEPDIETVQIRSNANNAILSSARRAKRNIRRFIYANAWQWLKPNGKPYTPIPITLTFDTEILDPSVGNKLFTKFISRLNYDVGITEFGKSPKDSKASFLKYLGVIEFQKESKRVHYHIIFFNLPFMKNIYNRMEKIWGEGFFNVNGKNKGSFKSTFNRKEINQVTDYYSKYVTDNCYDPRLFKKKKFFCSHGLLKPSTIYSENLIRQIMQILPEDSKLFEKKDIPIPYLYKFDYYRYEISQDQQLEKDIVEFTDPFFELDTKGKTTC